MQKSQELAETIFRAEKIANLVKQIDNINFCIKKSEPGKIFIKDNNHESEYAIVDTKDIEIPENMQSEINIEKICIILNDNLEEAKIEILRQIQQSILNPNNEEILEEDDFIPVKS